MTQSTRVGLTVACCLSEFIHTVYGSVVNIALPGISTQFHAGMDELQWVVSAYIIALASLLTVAGTLADRFGRRRMLVLGNVIMIAGAVVCALSPGIPMLIAGRVLQGIGSALIAPAGLALLTAAVSARSQRAAEVMWWTATGTVTLAAGPILGGIIVKDLGWTSVFWAGVPLGILATVLAVLLLRESKADSTDPVDPIGVVLATVVIAALAFALIEGPHLGWLSPTVLAAIIITVVSASVLIPYEVRRRYPAIPIVLFADRGFSAALATGLLGYLALAGLLFLNTFYLQSARGLDATAAGLMTIPLAVGALITAVLAARLVARGRSRAALVAAGLLIVAGSLALWATEHGPLWTIMLPYFVFGLGFGLIADPISVTALASLPPDRAGLASSLISTAKQVGQMLGIAGVGALLAVVASASDAVKFDDMGGWVWSMLTIAGALIVVLTISAPRTQPASARRTA